MKEVVINLRKRSGVHDPISINSAKVEMGEATTKKANQYLYFLRTLRKFSMSPLTLTNTTDAPYKAFCWFASWLGLGTALPRNARN